MKNSKLHRLETLKELLSDGIKYIPNLDTYVDKIDSIISTVKDQEISIVLLGSFSDGKTSAIAGLLGRLEDNMKIDNDESSDELTIYRPVDLKKGFKIVDTPGLFGTKEKEISGRQVKFSQITERYISEAHILIYVCDAVVPLKDSHVEVIRRILRDYGKLDNTVFVINKMDEAGYDLLDESDFSNGCRIKKENLIDRLRSTINLTPDEEKRLYIICIAADPKGRGLGHWFSKIEEYYKRSHINDLRQCVNTIIERSDSSKLLDSTTLMSFRDAIDGIEETIDRTTKPVSKAIDKIKNHLPELKDDQEQLKKELKQSKKELSEAINNIRNDAIRAINGASLETIGDVISEQIGVQEEKVSFCVFLDKLNAQVDQCCETNSDSLQTASVKLEKSYALQEKMLGEAVEYGAKYLKNIKISGDQVKAVRDVVAKNYKFKPWGAVNLGKNLTKWAGWIGAGISVAFELRNWIKANQDQKKLAELKKQLVNEINKIVGNLCKSFESEESYYTNYAPSYLELCKKISERDSEISKMETRVKELEGYKKRIEDLRISAKDAEYTKINAL